MNFDDIYGQEHIKKQLQSTISNGRFSHANLFVGKEGTLALPMAIAFANEILCATAADKDSCELFCRKYSHPDLHFVFPVASEGSTKKVTSNQFLPEWISFLNSNINGSLFEWLNVIGVGNKQGLISVEQASQIIQDLKLKSSQGGYKVMLIWMAEKMNASAANKILKILEEPPQKTVFILISEDDEQILDTIKSRCQIYNFPLLSENDITNYLINIEGTDTPIAQTIAQQVNGNINKALHLLHNDNTDEMFEEWFLIWIRSAFKAKSNAKVINTLISWSDEISKSGRETQKSFLNFCLHYFRQALLLNYGAEDLVYIEPKNNNFKLENFAPFVHGKNILLISDEINNAIYHIERNGNSKIILFDLSIKLTKLLHIQENS